MARTINKKTSNRGGGIPNRTSPLKTIPQYKTVYRQYYDEDRQEYVLLKIKMKYNKDETNTL